MLEKFRQRSYELEHLDKGDYTPEEYEGCIVELQWVNEWLGDASALSDYVLQSLTLHHFDDEGAVRILREMNRVAKRGLFVIDLHRNPIAYFLYTTVGHLFLHNRLIREDGALSILRSFKPDELRAIAHQAELANVKVEKNFPSRLILSAGHTGSQ